MVLTGDLRRAGVRFKLQLAAVNREFVLAPAKLTGAQALSHHSSWPSTHNFWLVGTAIHNFWRGIWREWRSLNRDRHSHGVFLPSLLTSRAFT